MLTLRQSQCLDAIYKLTLNSGGVCPTQREIATEIGLKGVVQINRIVNALIERGFLRRLARKARALEVIKRDNGALHYAFVFDDEIKSLFPVGLRHVRIVSISKQDMQQETRTA